MSSYRIERMAERSDAQLTGHVLVAPIGTILAGKIRVHCQCRLMSGLRHGESLYWSTLTE